MVVTSTGQAAQVQWDRMGLYYATGQTLHGRQDDDDDDDLIGIFSSWAIQIYKLVTQENKNSILDIIN